jgi:GH35 family endo-1,4-beta-xylanase
MLKQITIRPEKQKKCFRRKLKTTMIVAFIILLSVFDGFAQNNLIVNGGFENKTTGWMVWGATLNTTTDVHSGTGAAIVTNRKNPWDAIVQDVTSKLVNNRMYKLTAWVKFPKTTSNFRATFQIDNGTNKTYHGFLRTANPVVGSYVKYSEIISISWTGTLKSAQIYFESESVNGVYSDYLIDDVELEIYTPPADIIQTGEGWKDIKSTMRIGGCVTDGLKNYFNSDAAKAQVLKDCNSATVQCYAAWGRWDENKRHVYHVDEFSLRVREMKKHNMTVTAHMLMGWDQYFPEWFRKNDFPADTLDAIMKSWIKGIINYQGNDTLVDVWNVVNEAISWNGKGGYWPVNHTDFNSACEWQRMGYEPDASGLTGTKFVNSQHPVYIRKAFEYARTQTKKKLELRDSGFEFPTDSKYNAMYQLAVHLKKLNVPVDVIGFQTHIDIDKNYDWDGYANNIKRYIDLGYEVIIPEVDIGDVTKNWSDEKAEKQKQQYYKLVTAAIKGGASDLQTWGFIDNPANGWRKDENAFPYTLNYDPKPAYFGVKEALIDMSSVLFWEMNATVDNKMPDVMKYNNFGTLANFGIPVLVTGYKSKAVLFDGVDDYISTSQLKQSISGNFTFSCFIKSAATKSSVIAEMFSGTDKSLKLGINADGKIYFDCNGESVLTGLTAVNDNSWHFLAVQLDSNIYRLYIDDSAPVAQAQGSASTISKLAIGAKSDGTSAFAGAVDEVKLYDWKIEENSFVRNYAPSAPTKLTIAQPSGLNLQLTWTDQSSNEKGFILERKASGGNWEEIIKLPANTVAYNDVLSKYETEFSYRVRSYTTAGKSFESNIVNYTTPKDTATGIAGIPSVNLVSVFPNPARTQLTILSEAGANIMIFDIQGKQMLVRTKCSVTESVDISEFTQGLYLVRMENNSKTGFAKFVKN